MWFRSRRHRTEQKMLQKLDDITQHLGDVLDKLSEHRIQVTVQSLHVDKASLERLVFHLESLDIKELSGALNLGNNFGTDVIRAKKDDTKGVDGATQESVSQTPKLEFRQPREQKQDFLVDGTQIQSTDRGFRVTPP